MAFIDNSINNSSNSNEISLDFTSLITKQLPHEIGLTKDVEMNNKNFFISTIQLLTNIPSLYCYCLSSSAENNNYIKLCISFSKQEKKELKKNIRELNIYVLEKLNYNNKDDDPRKLIPFILKDIRKYLLLPYSFVYNFEYKCNKCQNILKNDELKFIVFDIPKIIDYYQKTKNTITIYDCFHYYFNSLNNYNSDDSNLFCEKCQGRKFDVILKTLPTDLMIFINYGTELKNYDLSFNFDEEINFKDFDFLDENDRKKELFLSSLIACKNMGTNLEIYYTFARKNKNSNYKIYNGLDVRDDKKVDNKLKKEKMNFTNYKESWPVVLIFTD